MRLRFWRWLSRFACEHRNRAEPGPWIVQFGRPDPRFRVETDEATLTYTRERSS